MGASATWAFVVFERIGAHFYLVVFRSGLVLLTESDDFVRGSVKVTNNTGEVEAFGDSLGWFRIASGTRRSALYR